MFSNKKLPTVHDCLLYVLSRTNKDAKRSQTRQQIIWEPAKIVEDVWNKADCCPYTQKHIATLFEKNVGDKYTFLLREKRLPRDENTTKRSHKKDTSEHKDRGEPTHKSRRIQSTVDVPTKNGFSTNTASLDCNKSTIARSKSSLESLRDLWTRFGKMLFDVKSQTRVHECSTIGLCFDESFYNDQPSERKIEMYLGKVNREYADQEQERIKRETRQQSRLKPAFYSTTETSYANDIIDEPIDIHTESEDECVESLLKSPEPTSVNFIITRNNQKRFSGAEQKAHTAYKTEFVPFRRHGSHRTRIFSLCRRF